MRMSNAEKLIVTMLADVLKSTEAETDLDADFIQSAIFDDQTWAIEWRYHGLFDSNPDETPPIVHEVVDVLSTWSLIEDSFERLEEVDRDRIESECDPIGRDPKFRGFDGNNEVEYLSVAHFLVEKMGRFEKFAKRDLNSHMPTVDMNRRLVSAYKGLDRPFGAVHLSADEIIQLINAQRG